MSKASLSQILSRQLPSSSGTYLLCFQSRVSRRVAIGRLGLMALVPGFYCYVGSAFGPGGLRARVGRHALRHKAKRWHIDYLRPHLGLVEVWIAEGGALESAWSQLLVNRSDARVPMPGFGASDCPGEEHLVWFSGPTDLSDLLGGQGGSVCRIGL